MSLEWLSFFMFCSCLCSNWRLDCARCGSIWAHWDLACVHWGLALRAVQIDWADDEAAAGPADPEPVGSVGRIVLGPGPAACVDLALAGISLAILSIIVVILAWFSPYWNWSC